MSIKIPSREAMFKVINPCKIQTAEIAVFIPSFNEASNIGLVVKKISVGLQKYYPNLSSVIVNCDNNSCDATQESFFSAECAIPRIYITTPPGSFGKGANLRNVFQCAADLSAKTILLFDANLLSIKTTWIKILAEPIIKNSQDFISPMYIRHKYDAPLTRYLVAPFLRTIFGRRVLQPISIDHAFSSKVNQLYLNSSWDDDDRGYKSDMKMLSTVIMNNVPICQSFLGYPRISTNIKDLDIKFKQSFVFILKAIFELMLETEDFWLNIKRSRPTILDGADRKAQNIPPEMEIDIEYFKRRFNELAKLKNKNWIKYFSPPLANELQTLFLQVQNGNPSSLEVELWRDILFEAAVVYKNSSETSRTDLLEALIPLFFLKLITVYSLLKNMTNSQFKSFLENEAICFESGKQKLIKNWKSQ